MNTKEKEVLREEVKKLLEEGYTYEEIDKTVKYAAERDRLLGLAAIEGWDYITENESLPIEFIREFEDKLDWGLVSIYQKLTEDQIREFSDELDWFYIFLKNDLSKDFLYENQQIIRTHILNAINDTETKSLNVRKYPCVEHDYLGGESEFDAQGRLIRHKDKYGSEEFWNYYDDGTKKLYRNTNGLIEKYDKDGKKIYSENADVKIWYHDDGSYLCENSSENYVRYDSNGNPISIKHKNGYTESFEYDEEGRVIKYEASDGFYTVYEYENTEDEGLKLCIVHEKNFFNEDLLTERTKIINLANNKIISQTDEDGVRKCIIYDTDDNIDYTYDSNGKVVLYKNGKVRAIIDPVNTIQVK